MTQDIKECIIILSCLDILWCVISRVESVGRVVTTFLDYLLIVWEKKKVELKNKQCELTEEREQ